MAHINHRSSVLKMEAVGYAETFVNKDKGKAVLMLNEVPRH